MSNDDCEYLISTLSKLISSHNITHPQAIRTPYHGSFYRVIHNDDKMKIYQKGDITKVYMHPTFRPKCS